ncbi:hypothetical protein [Novipirellula sp.]|uniref:hypothetical protein n=1 Tax=Novipirellula sp. TaxID=2795430 RepID=UPI003563E816
MIGIDGSRRLIVSCERTDEIQSADSIAPCQALRILHGTSGTLPWLQPASCQWHQRNALLTLRLITRQHAYNHGTRHGHNLAEISNQTQSIVVVAIGWQSWHVAMVFDHGNSVVACGTLCMAVFTKQLSSPASTDFVPWHEAALPCPHAVDHGKAGTKSWRCIVIVLYQWWHNGLDTWLAVDTVPWQLHVICG